MTLRVACIKHCTTRQCWRAKDLYTDICHNSSVLASQGFIHRHLPQLVSVGEPRIYTQTFATTCQCWRAKDLYTDSYTTLECWRAKDLYTDICHNSSVLASQGFIHRHLPQLVSVGEPRIYTQTVTQLVECTKKFCARTTLLCGTLYIYILYLFIENCYFV